VGKPKLIHPLSKEDDERCMARWRRTPRTRAVRVLPADATDEQWHAARRAGIGASELASVLGVQGAYGSPFSVWWAKKLQWETDPTMAMVIGSKLEPVIGELFAEQRPDLLVARPDGRLWQHWQHPWMLATPDFLAVTEQGTVEPVEAKSDEGGSEWGQPGTDQIPGKHRVQLLMQCAVLGAERGHLVRLAGKRFTMYTVEALADDDQLLAAWVEAGYRFMGSLELDVPPEPDAHPQTEAALQRLWPAPAEPDEDGQPKEVYLDDEVADEFLAAHTAKKVAEIRYQLARNVLRERMRDASVALRASDSTPIAERRLYKRSGYEVGPCMVDEIRRKSWS
jgi:predicted phage-related endonuclease